MKNRKTIITSIAVLLITMVTGYSLASGMQGKNGMNPMQGPGMAYIFTELNITDEQQTEIQGIMSEFRDEMRATMADRTERPTDEERAAHQLLLKDKLSTVLTANQVDGLEKYMEAHSKGRGDKGQGFRGDHGQRNHMSEKSGSCDQDGQGRGYKGNNS